MPQHVGVGSSSRIGTNYGPVTPSDTVRFADEVAGIWVGGAGNVALVKRDNTAVTFAGVPAGTFLPLACIGVNATNTTATLMNWVM